MKNKCQFCYDRINKWLSCLSTMSFEFAIYKEAHWEIIVVFTAYLFEEALINTMIPNMKYI